MVTKPDAPTADDGLARSARSHDAGWRAGMVEGALAELQARVGSVPDAVIAERVVELARRFGWGALVGHPLVAALAHAQARQDHAPPAVDRGTCSSCGAPIGWIRSPEGRPQPVDLPPRLARVGLTAVQGVDETGAVVRGAVAESLASAPLRWVWRSHFATCPQADQHRRGEVHSDDAIRRRAGRAPAEPR